MITLFMLLKHSINVTIFFRFYKDFNSITKNINSLLQTVQNSNKDG